eukprot:CAMPEP_0169485462 /NCGR_PEP_ID=MMETSP1042-20121227/32302_1 /TAXON_ID=464988 /ORGANISM="Hemiselmis andersenii, Strain CCMP1180" /LENGTH=163 /DNA_ID=CAMNT_0009600559 /DNA_START=172 /DNA_END=660 /DNA_ORIENTATION=-
MATHAVTIPSLAPVANFEQPHGGGALGVTGAPVPAVAAAVHEGDAPDSARIGDAAEDTNHRKKMKTIGQCTNAEVGDAIAREVQVAISYSANMAGAPVWGMNLQQQTAALQQQTTTLQQQFQQHTVALQQQTAALQQQTTTLQQQFQQHTVALQQQTAALQQQ